MGTTTFTEGAPGEFFPDQGVAGAKGSVELFARHRLLICESDSAQYAYWRGVLLGIESTKPNSLADVHWADIVAKGFRS